MSRKHSTPHGRRNPCSMKNGTTKNKPDINTKQTFAARLLWVLISFLPKWLKQKKGGQDAGKNSSRLVSVENLAGLVWSRRNKVGLSAGWKYTAESWAFCMKSLSLVCLVPSVWLGVGQSIYLWGGGPRNPIVICHPATSKQAWPPSQDPQIWFHRSTSYTKLI